VLPPPHGGYEHHQDHDAAHVIHSAEHGADMLVGQGAAVGLATLLERLLGMSRVVTKLLARR